MVVVTRHRREETIQQRHVYITQYLAALHLVISEAESHVLVFYLKVEVTREPVIEEGRVHITRSYSL